MFTLVSVWRTRFRSPTRHPSTRASVKLHCGWPQHSLAAGAFCETIFDRTPWKTATSWIGPVCSPLSVSGQAIPLLHWNAGDLGILKVQPGSQLERCPSTVAQLPMQHRCPFILCWSQMNFIQRCAIKQPRRVHRPLTACIQVKRNWFLQRYEDQINKKTSIFLLVPTVVRDRNADAIAPELIANNICIVVQIIW